MRSVKEDASFFFSIFDSISCRAKAAQAHSRFITRRADKTPCYWLKMVRSFHVKWASAVSTLGTPFMFNNVSVLIK